MARNPYAPRFYNLGPNHELIECADAAEWSYGSVDRVVAQTGNYGKPGGIGVSTIFLGLDHRFFGDGPPLVFETMVFRDSVGNEMERYSSWAAAEAGHKRWVKKVFPALARQKAKRKA